MNYLFGFSGRIGRLKWWGGQLIIIMILIGGFIFIGETIPDSIANATSGQMASSFIVLIAGIILCFWINLAITVKRYHDRSKSAWWVLCGLVPFIGAIWQMVECGCLSGTGGVNDYGPPLDGGGGGLDDEIAAMKLAKFGSPEPESQTPPAPVVSAVAAVAAAPAQRPPRRSGKPSFGQRGA